MIKRFINDSDFDGYGECTMLSLRGLFYAQSPAEESPLLPQEGVSAGQECGLAEGEDANRSGLSCQPEAESEDLA